MTRNNNKQNEFWKFMQMTRSAGIRLGNNREKYMKQLSLILMLALGLLGTVAGVSQAADTRKAARPNGGVLSYGEYGRPATLDPITSNEMISLRISELLFNGLVGINERQDVVPELAQSWEVSKDGRVYTFSLRKDVTWHQRPGEALVPFTANDVIFTYNIMMNPKTITPLKVRFEFIEKAEKLDDYTVRFTLKRPDRKSVV